MGTCVSFTSFPKLHIIVQDAHPKSKKNTLKNRNLLMMQEAKERCHGKWYIPGNHFPATLSAVYNPHLIHNFHVAGRVEHGESPYDGAVREVKEETGLDMQPTGVFAIEYKPSKHRNWIRYAVTGNIIGGTLKTQVSHTPTQR